MTEQRYTREDHENYRLQVEAEAAPEEQARRDTTREAARRRGSRTAVTRRASTRPMTGWPTRSQRTRHAQPTARFPGSEEKGWSQQEFSNRSERRLWPARRIGTTVR
jgi:hypothetical protein